VALATGTATFIGRLYFGLEPAFRMPALATLSHHPTSFSALLLFALLGVLSGLAATAFIKGLHWVETVFDGIWNPYLRHATGMLFVGVIIYALFQAFGHYHVEGVGYATVQEVLLGGLVTAPLLGLLFVCKLTATSLSLGSGSSGGIFSPSLFLGATLGGAFGAFAKTTLPWLNLSIPAFAIVGMAALVGGGTGAAMTAVTMIFEMTRDYDIVMPMIIAVALSIGVRRVLSQENIYTIKLVSRRHFIPKALHANMFLVHRAGDVMDRDILLLPTDTSFDTFLRQPKHEGKIRHVVITGDDKIVGVLRVNTGIRHGLENAYTGVTLDNVASHDFTIAYEEDIMFGVIGRMWQRGAIMAVVIRGNGVPLVSNVVGVITKEHVADSVALSVRPYTSIEPDRKGKRQRLSKRKRNPDFPIKPSAACSKTTPPAKVRPDQL
jgi:chloride channel protein, CIC family